MPATIADETTHDLLVSLEGGTPAMRRMCAAIGLTEETIAAVARTSDDEVEGVIAHGVNTVLAGEWDREAVAAAVAPDMAEWNGFQISEDGAALLRYHGVEPLLALALTFCTQTWYLVIEGVDGRQVAIDLWTRTTPEGDVGAMAVEAEIEDGIEIRLSFGEDASTLEMKRELTDEERVDMDGKPLRDLVAHPALAACELAVDTIYDRPETRITLSGSTSVLDVTAA